jgi:phosphoglucomutase
VTNQIYAGTTAITEYRTTEPAIACDLSQIGKHTFFVDGGRQFVVEVIDPVADYLALMKEIFDFSSIKTLVTSEHKPFRLLLNSMHGGKL